MISPTTLNQYNPSSPILILGICSFTKNQLNSDEPYHTESSITSRLTQKNSIELLYKIRNENLFLLKKSELITKTGSKLRNHTCNKVLGKGPDFAGNEQVQYLSAIERYTGRFYQGFLNDGSIFRWSNKCLHSPHHTLIISGLYGLVTPIEQIQLYESPLEDLIEIQEILKKDDALTNILIDYILSNHISRVFDVTGDNAYQKLINWPLLKEHGIETLHASAEDHGPDQLRHLGILMNSFLLDASTEQLLTVSPGQKIRNVTFMDYPERYGPLIFISCKSEDYLHAERFADFLNREGKNSFFCEKNMRDIGNSDYSKLIETALEEAKHLVVIGTQKEYFQSDWVRHEWDGFLREKLSGRKSGNIITLIDPKISIGDLPLSLRGYQVLDLTEDGFYKALGFLQ